MDESYLENLQMRQAADEEIDARYERMRRMQERDEGREADLEGTREYEREESDDDDEEDEEDGPPGTERRLILEAFECPLREWISENRTRREIKARFKKFLQGYYVGMEAMRTWEVKHKDDEERPPCPYKKHPPIYPAKVSTFDILTLTLTLTLSLTLTTKVSNFDTCFHIRAPPCRIGLGLGLGSNPNL